VRVLNADREELTSATTDADGAYSVLIALGSEPTWVECSDTDGTTNGSYQPQTVRLENLTGDQLPTVDLEAV